MESSPSVVDRRKRREDSKKGREIKKKVTRYRGHGQRKRYATELSVNWDHFMSHWVKS